VWPRHLFGKAEPLKLAGPGDHEPPQFRVFARSAGPEVDDTGAGIGVVAQGAVEIGPALSLHFLFQGRTDFPLGTRAEL
jgi:hypothetical protein